MLKACFLALAAALSVGAAPAAPPSLVPADPAAAGRVRGHVEFLADDLLEGREPGTRGYDIAAGYVASQFRALGLQPGGEKGGWYQQVPLRTATFGDAPPLVELIGPRHRRPLAFVTEIVARPSVQEQNLDATAPLVFVGYGIDAPALGIDDYRGLDVRGKVAVVLAGTPAGLATEIAAHLDQAKDAMAAKHGAIGIVLVASPQARGGAYWRFRMGSHGRPVTDWVDGSGRAGSSPAGFRFALAATDAGAAALFDGARRSFAAVQAEAARAGARPGGFALPGRLRVRTSSRWSDFRSAEVIGLLPGSDPQLRGEHVVLMGHLDHLGIKKDAKPGEDRIYNGAIDNAAGVATMLEAARMFTASGSRPRRSVLFIANTGEERGLLGADYYASHPTVPIDRIVGVVDLDMPLPLYDFTDIVAFGAEHSTVAETVARAAATMNIAVSADPMPQEAIFVRSDHYKFVLRGVPAILLFTGHANGGKAVWDRWLPNIYHTPQDDAAQPINWNALARYAEVNYRISRALADDPRRPRWYRGDFFGDTFAPGQPRAEPKP